MEKMERKGGRGMERLHAIIGGFLSMDRVEIFLTMHMSNSVGLISGRKKTRE